MFRRLYLNRLCPILLILTKYRSIERFYGAVDAIVVDHRHGFFQYRSFVFDGITVVINFYSIYLCLAKGLPGHFPCLTMFSEICKPDVNIL